MDSINFSCQGESHIAAGKVCQDYSYSKVYENGNAIAIVCDGHGGKRYFRSDVGAKIAAEVTEQKVLEFVGAVGSILKGQPFTQESAISTQIDNHDFEKLSPIERAFRQLFSSIIFEWNTRVETHAKANPIADDEKPGLEERWIKEFDENHNLEKVYGCTLITFVSTPTVWFAFQIGDGKCFALDAKGKWSEPIPWDDRCFLNKTTSICDSGAIDEFRYCFCGDGSFPAAIILGSDGIDDSFGTEVNQANFYVQILKSLVKEGVGKTITEIETTLPQLSKIGSQDDMSISMVFNLEDIGQLYPTMIEWQIENVKGQIAEENAKIEKANRVQSSLEQVERPTKQNMIDLQYANADEKRAIESRTKLQGRLDNLLKELNPEIEEESLDEPTVNRDNSELPESSNDSSVDEINENTVVDNEKVQSDKTDKES